MSVKPGSFFNESLADDSYIRLDGTSVTTASIPFAQGISISSDKFILLDGGSQLQDSSIQYDTTISTFKILGGNDISSGLGGASIEIHAGDGIISGSSGGWVYNTAGNSGADGFGGSVYFTSGIGDGASGGSGNIIFSVLSPTNGAAAGEIQFNINGSLKAYLSSTIFTSLVRQTINVNSTTALLVEQDGVNDNVLVVDTSQSPNGVVGINNVGVDDQALTVGGTTNKGIVVSQTFTGATTLARATSLTHTFNGTGLAAFGSGSSPVLSLATFVDERGVTSGTSDGITGLQFNLSRGSSYNFTKTSGVGIVTIGAITGTSSDNGTYNINSGNITYTKKALDFAVSFSAQYDGGTGTVRTMNATIIAVDARLGTSNPAIINASNGVLNTNTYMVRSTGTGWTSGTTDWAVGFYNAVTGFDSVWGYINETTTSNNHFGKDNVKNYRGTGTGTFALRTLAPDVYDTYTGTNWIFEHEIVAASATTIFNSLVADVDFEVGGDTDTLLHLDAGGGTSFFEPNTDSATAFSFRDAASNVDLSYDSTNQALSLASGTNLIISTTTGTKIGTGTNQLIGFWNATPVAQSTGWAMSNVTSDKVLDANATTLDEVADVLGTLIDQLKTYGILGA